jgi:hypothetical protein
MSKKLDLLKHFFKNNKASSVNEAIIPLTSEIERELRKDNQLEKRVKLIVELGEIVMTNRIEEVCDFH